MKFIGFPCCSSSPTKASCSACGSFAEEFDFTIRYLLLLEDGTKLRHSLRAFGSAAETM